MKPLFNMVLPVGLLLVSAAAANAQSMQYSFGGYPGRANPRVNVYLSQRYDYLLQVNPRFRAYRMRRECSPITWLGLWQDCIASFDQYEPMLVVYRRS